MTFIRFERDIGSGFDGRLFAGTTGIACPVELEGGIWRAKEYLILSGPYSNTETLVAEESPLEIPAFRSYRELSIGPSSEVRGFLSLKNTLSHQ